MRGKAGQLLWLALALSACAAPPPSQSPHDAPVPTGMTRVHAKSALALPGTSQPLALYTHCGLASAVIDFAGTLWDVADPPPSPQGGAVVAPRTGIGDPQDQGTITLLGLGHAVFTAASGARLALVPHAGPKDVPGCF